MCKLFTSITILNLFVERDEHFEMNRNNNTQSKNPPIYIEKKVDQPEEKN